MRYTSKQKKNEFDSTVIISTTTGGAMLGASLGNFPGFIIGTAVGLMAGAYAEFKPKPESYKKDETPVHH